MASKILPVKKPIISTFPAYAASLAIFLQNYEKSYNWMFSQYIQIYAIDILNRKKTDFRTVY